MVNEKQRKTREELIERLKEIASEEVPQERHRGAMCYSIAPPEDFSTECDYCKSTIIYSSWSSRKIIHEIVDEITGLGYDAKVAVLCNECFKKLKAELYPEVEKELVLDEEHKIEMDCYNRNFVFYFRVSSDETYNCALSSNQDHYNAVLSFLKGEKAYRGYRIPYEKKYIMKDIPIIEFMTGLKIEE